jgi:uncharacterized membrane protein
VIIETPVPSRYADSPTLQDVLMVTLGGLLIGAGGRGRAGALLRIGGALLISAAARPVVAQALRTTGARRRTVIAHSSLEIDRPIYDVFAFFKDFESFPRVIGALRSVTDYRDGRSRWEMYTPSGKIVVWNVVVTKYVPNSVIAWESVPDSPIEMRGIVRFAALGPARTKVHLALRYRPRYTGLNDALHALTRIGTGDRLSVALDRARFYVESFPAVVR